MKVGRFLYDPDKIPLRQARRLHEIAHFFDNDVCSEVLIPMVTQTMDISLRLIDWCLVNWAKKTKIVTMSPDGEPVTVYSCYKDALRHYRRRLFDPFRRRERIQFEGLLNKENVIFETTVGQLNFTFWALRYNILESCRKHVQAIEADMNSMLSESKKRRLEDKQSGRKRKRTELTVAPKSKVHIYVLKQNLEFDCKGKATQESTLDF